MGEIRFYLELAKTNGIVFFGPDDHTITAWRVTDGSTLWYPWTANSMMYIRKTDGTPESCA